MDRLCRSGRWAWNVAVLSTMTLLFMLARETRAGCYVDPDENGHVKIPEGMKTIPHGAFENCTKMLSIDIPTFVERIEGLAFTRSNLKNITIPASVKELGNSTLDLCPLLETVTINAEIEVLGEYTFFECTSLTSVSLPKTLKRIGKGAFEYCRKLDSIALPDSVEALSRSAFARCKSLTSIKFPQNLTRIGEETFLETSLKDVVIGENVTWVGVRAFANSVSGISNLTIDATNVEFAESVFHGSGLTTKDLFIAKNAQSIVGLVSDLTRIRCGQDQCTCGLGYGNGLPDTGLYKKYFQCVECEAGKTNDPPSVNACEDCAKGTYAELPQSPSCAPCPSGRYGTEIGQNSSSTCQDCKAGRYVSATGQSECDVCPPGNYAAQPGMDKYVPCQIGSFTDSYGRTNCTACPSGRYQSESGAAKCEGCSVGKYNPESGSTSDKACKGCPPGHYSERSGASQCTQCGKDEYSNGKVECKQCDEGKSTNDKLGQSSCSVFSRNCPPGTAWNERTNRCYSCPQGSYSSMQGSMQCVLCPPGSYCNETGLINAFPCPPGRFTDISNQTSCMACVPGTYQPAPGTAKCHYCDAGKANANYGSLDSNTSCVDCVAGKYSNQNGTAECSTCTDGHFQQRKGQTSCEVCSEYQNSRNVLTNNADHTECVVDEGMLSGSLVDSLFLRGGAYYVTFIILGVFVTLAGIMTVKREQQATRLGRLTRFEAFVKSFLPGFSFGSEMVLMFGVWVRRPDIAIAMFFFRLFHAYGLLALSALIFGSKRIPKAVEYWLPRAPDYTYDMDHKFARENVALVGSVMFVSLLDITYVQFLPWKKSRFFIESKGFPDMHILIFALLIKALQAFVNLVCVSVFLSYEYNIDSPTASWSAKILFFFSILFSTAGVIMGILLLVIKNKLLSEVEVEKEKQAMRRRSIASLDLGELGVDLEDLEEIVQEIEENGAAEVERRLSASHLGGSPTVDAVKRISATLETFDGSEASVRRLSASLVQVGSLSDALKGIRSSLTLGSPDDDVYHRRGSGNYDHSDEENENDYAGDDHEESGSRGSSSSWSHNIFQPARRDSSTSGSSFRMFDNPLHLADLQKKDEEIKRQAGMIAAQQREIERLRGNSKGMSGVSREIKRRSTVSGVGKRGGVDLDAGSASSTIYTSGSRRSSTSGLTMTNNPMLQTTTSLSIEEEGDVGSSSSDSEKGKEEDETWMNNEGVVQGQEEKEKERSDAIPGNRTMLMPSVATVKRLPVSRRAHVDDEEEEELKL